MFVCHPAKLHLDSGHSEGLGTRICRPQPGPICQLPEMLSIPQEAICWGDVPFLLNVNHKGVQFFAPFPKFTMTMYYDFWRNLGGFQDIHPPRLVAWFIWLQSISISPLDSSVLVFLGNFSSTPTSCDIMQFYSTAHFYPDGRIVWMSEGTRYQSTVAEWAKLINAPEESEDDLDVYANKKDHNCNTLDAAISPTCRSTT